MVIILKIEKKGRGGCVSGCYGAVRGGLRRQAICRSSLRLKPGSCGVGGGTNEAQDTGHVFVLAFPAAGHHQLMTRVFCEGASSVYAPRPMPKALPAEGGHSPPQARKKLGCVCFYSKKWCFLHGPVAAHHARDGRRFLCFSLRTE